MSRFLSIDVLAVFFGIGTWLCVNGLWVELPLLVQRLPEGWNLPSYLAVVIQIANIGPLLYTLLHSFFPRCVTEKRSTYFVMIVGLISTVLLALFWKETTIVFGVEHSTALLVLVFFLASVDCSSRVLYLPFMAQLQAIYLTSFFIGEGLSGFVPSIFALIQGVGGNPECHTNPDGNGTIAYTPDPVFSVAIFFYLLFAVTLASLVAFYFLNYNPVVQKALAVQSRSQTTREILLSTTETPFYQSTSSSNSNDSLSKRTKSSLEDQIDITQISTVENVTTKNEISSSNQSLVVSGVSKSVLVYLLLIQIVVCCLSNGVFPSIQSYSCLPYGNVAYHWTVTLSNMANPAVCFLAIYIPYPTKKSITSVAVLAILLSCYVMYTAVSSPTPPLVGLISGEILLVLSWILLVGLSTYVKISVATVLRSEGKRGLFWCGAVTQFGSAIGAIATFVVVNFMDVFQSYYPCT